MMRLALKHLTIMLAVSAISLSPLHVYAAEPVAAATSGTTAPQGSGDNNEAGLDLQLRDSFIKEKGTLEANHSQLVVDEKAYADVLKNLQRYIDRQPTCVKTHSGAAYACLENWSPNILTGVTTLNTLMSTVGSVAVKDQCSKFARGMDIAKAAMTAYTAACGSAKAGCGFYCVSARDALKDFKKSAARAEAVSCKNPAAGCGSAVTDFNTSLRSMSKMADDELKGNVQRSTAGKAGLCTEKYANLLTSAVAGIASLMNAIKQGKECEEETEGDPTTPASDPLKEKCSDPANANLPECICLKNPRTPGCSNAFEKPGDLSAGGNIGTGATDRTNIAAPTGGPDLGPQGPADMPIPERNPTSDSGGVGAPSGGGASLGGGGLSGGGGAGGDKSEASKKGLDTNILGGAGGGGGGGGWGAAGGGSSANSKYRSYLPGGKNDPNKGMAGSQAWTKEVTGQGGKSNWDKIKERYRDNKGTLLSN
ncbi:hypothetical protein [Bdellovibrio reynosensis]|uniref:Uncharacterized protein n=1 Tax=Bdellovibrio reynosensis TaxID=2835041 RepID=A0ABY4CDX1_9BACT|nr:hypothetical protein [Bdellovibrio reynosensis]UOF02989.1 hypothetical protein MNR06_12600 [Bdellovibrio reynosensis]